MNEEESKKRAEARRRKMTVRKFRLHDKEHHSFHFELNQTQSWNLLYSISIAQWEHDNGKKAPRCVDKTKVKIIKLWEK